MYHLHNNRFSHQKQEGPKKIREIQKEVNVKMEKEMALKTFSSCSCTDKEEGCENKG